MNIVVCVKQVPDTEAQIRVKGDGSGIDEGGIKWVMNPYDEFAVEEALRIVEKFGGEVTVVSVGPARVTETIRTALAMGAEKGIHLDDSAVSAADAFVTASALAGAIRGLSCDLVLCGQRAVDDDSGQVGAMLAELLDLPQITSVTKLEIDGTTVRGTRAIEGAQLVVETSLPCVITAAKGLNEPRYASLPGIMKAKKKQIEGKAAAEVSGAEEPKAQVVSYTPPPARPPGRILCGDGTPEGKAAELARLLREEAKVI